MKRLILSLICFLSVALSAIAIEFHYIGTIDGRGKFTEEENYSQRIDVDFIYGGQLEYYLKDGHGKWTKGPYLTRYGRGDTYVLCGPLDDFETLMMYFWGHPELGILVYTINE